MAVDSVENVLSRSSKLCLSCGLCCTGYLFVNAIINSNEVETASNLRLTVLQPENESPIFDLPCPLWKGRCTIYSHPHKPSICASFRCKLLISVEEDQLDLEEALSTVATTMKLIEELEAALPAGSVDNFRKRLFETVCRLEQSTSPTTEESLFRLRAGTLLVFFEQKFGVKDLFNRQV